MKTTVLVISIFALCAIGNAKVAPSNASLKGTYGFNISKAETDSWYAEVSCPNYAGPIFVGSVTSTPVDDGTLSFDGNGNVTFSFYKYGTFDQTLSNQTPTWTCDKNGNPVITNSGQPVFDAPSSQSGSGTYSIQSDYTGVFNPSGSSDQFILRVAQLNAKGLATTLMLHGVGSNNSNSTDGIAIKQ